MALPVKNLIIFSFLFLYGFDRISDAQIVLPPRLDGFPYKNRQVSINSVMIEAFLDPVCPDSKESWPPLKKVLEHYGDNVSLIVHPFALPYHDNAFVTSRALHIANKINTSTTYDLLELFFEHQEKFYNFETFNVSRAKIIKRIVNLATEVVGKSYFDALEAGFSDALTDLSTRVSFKYGCSRGVSGTPFFFVNGFVLPGGGSAIPYDKWTSIIDPLVKSSSP